MEMPILSLSQERDVFLLAKCMLKELAVQRTNVKCINCVRVGIPGHTVGVQYILLSSYTLQYLIIIGH